ncbi:TPA: phage tail tape measure protein [Pseudomonas aeruginosa]|uniref:phage tail tape measure protein n=1 Tax=Pseudomonas aeruginosa TaxID=287 RepID=UPI00071BFB36|nr:phage tail tape measure protein [Pseudomonas aeruginosa]KSM05660.1 phage tail tape measure protein [Pseudomonas aeruginosa]TQH66121.1 phage tail tape measure protein [Pseudomonas aeruginosa]HCF2632785.1 phage tail tape measure protein [Pseudomonas aeruginosa]HCF3993976.1 phage tail tape measure protein [Pseudomonas aeruginosa]
MAEESRLSIIIDSRGAEKNATSLSDALDRVERSGDEAAGSTSRLSEVTVRLGSNMSKAAAATVASLSRIERATESTSSQMTALVSRAVALENAMSSVGQGIGRLDTGITQSNAQLGQLNTQMSHLVSTFSTFSQGQSAINAQLSRIAANMSRAADETQNLDQSTSRAGRGAREAASDLDAERAGLARLLGQINPTVAALDRLDDMQQRLTRYKNLRLVDAETVAEYTERLTAMRNALGDAEGGMNRTGMSAKALSANMRMLPAQITDIVVGLSSGQAPLTVLLQQGGQLKDMFGGIGPAAKALGGYIAGLVNPLTLAAAAVATLGVAYYQGSEETEAMTNAIIANGNAAGTSASKLAALAQQIGQGNATVGQAAEALTALAAGGNRLTDLYERIATGAIAWSKATGKSIQEVIASFNDLSKDPVGAVKKLDEELNILTASQYANIQSLQERGQKEEAARVATEAYADAVTTRSSQMADNLGILERSWNSVAGAAKGAWDSMLNIGRTSSIDSEIADIERRLAQPKFGLLTSDAEFARSKEMLREQLDFLKARKEAQQYDEKYFAEQSALQAAGKKGIDLINSTFAAAQTQTEKLQKQLVELDKARKAAMEAGGFTAEEETKFAVARKNIEQQIADIKEREAKKSAPKTRGQNVGVREADNTASRLLAQYDPAGQAVRTLTKEQQQLDLAWRKGKITLDEYGKALAQASLNYAAAIKGAQGLTAAEQYQAQMERQLLLQREQYAAQAAAVGMGGLEAERYQQRIQLEQQSNDRVLQLQTELAQATTEKQRQELQAQIDLEREYLPKRIQAQKDGYQQMDKARQDWLAGAASGARTWFEQIDDTASQTRSAMMRGLDGLNDELHTFVTTGKASFRSLTTSVLSDLARIAQNKFITSLISSMSGSSNGVISAIGSYFTANAKGGVYSSPSLSAFSNGVYNSPQFFAFAKGAGVFGEAGPEAIMPLTRAADGSLGVRAIGSGGAKSAGGNTFQINTNVTVTSGTTSQSVTSDTNDNYAMQLSKMIADVARGVIAQESQPGGIIWRMQNGR